jgi:hypothetical protein
MNGVFIDNLSHKPDFAYTNEPNNVHLAANSFCINKGNPGLTYTGQQDIDGEDRVMGSFVDVGADEVDPACNDVYHPIDWNADGVVNLLEFSEFSHSWMTCDPNRPGGTSGYDPNDLLRWNSKCDLDQDYDVDLADLVILADNQTRNWLWVACWRLELQSEQLEQMMNMAPAGGMQMQSSLSDFTSVKTSIITTEKPIREQIIELKDTIQFLEEIWERSFRSLPKMSQPNKVYNSLTTQKNEHEIFGHRRSMKTVMTLICDISGLAFAGTITRFLVLW